MTSLKNKERSKKKIAWNVHFRPRGRKRNWRRCCCHCRRSRTTIENGWLCFLDADDPSLWKHTVLDSKPNAIVTQAKKKNKKNKKTPSQYLPWLIWLNYLNFPQRVTIYNTYKQTYICQRFMTGPKQTSVTKWLHKGGFSAVVAFWNRRLCSMALYQRHKPRHVQRAKSSRTRNAQKAPGIINFSKSEKIVATKAEEAAIKSP